VREEVERVLAERPHFRARPGPGEGGPRDSGPQARPQPGLSDLLKS
jgi:hypothetical protein